MNSTLNTTKQVPKCKFCKSGNIVKYGFFKNIQRWWCKDCHRKFADNHAMPKMKTAINQVGLAIIAYYEGVPIATIREQLIRKFGVYISFSTIFTWIDTLSQSASYEARNCILKTSAQWAVIVSTVKIRGENYCFIDVIDQATQFLLATVASQNIGVDVISRLLDSARIRTGNFPLKMIILGNQEFGAKINSACSQLNLNFQTDLKSDSSFEFNDISEHFLRKRSIVLSRLRKNEHLQIIVDGWIVHYNFFKRHELLNGLTPAEKAGVSITTPE